MDRQCSSCGGFCKKSGCERENVKPKEWVGLTDEDRNKLRHLVDWTVPLDIKKFADSVEAVLKGKNT